MILVREAIMLGDRLKEMREATPEIAEKIRKFQEVLRRLPDATPNVSAGYGFSIMNLQPGFRCVNRSWFVSTQPQNNGLIEIASVYTVLPDRDESEERAQEDWFGFFLMGTPETDPTSYARWMEQVRDPNMWRRPDQEFEIEAAFDESFQ